MAANLLVLEILLVGRLSHRSRAEKFIATCLLDLEHGYVPSRGGLASESFKPLNLSDPPDP